VAIEVPVVDSEDQEAIEEIEVATEAAVVKAEEKAEAREEISKVKENMLFKKVRHLVSTDLEVEEAIAVIVVVALVKAEAVAELCTDPKPLEMKVNPPKVTRVKLLLIQRKKLIIEEEVVSMDIKANLENNIIHMIEKMVLEEEEVYPRADTVKETGVMLRMKLKAKNNQLKVVPLKRNQRLKK
jgi:hypothetical protein